MDRKGMPRPPFRPPPRLPPGPVGVSLPLAGSVAVGAREEREGKAGGLEEEVRRGGRGGSGARFGGGKEGGGGGGREEKRGGRTCEKGGEEGEEGEEGSRQDEEDEAEQAGAAVTGGRGFLSNISALRCGMLLFNV